MDRKNAFILWFDQLGIEDVPLVGGKNASLGEMYQDLVPKGVGVPNGFAITAHAYFHLLDKQNIRDEVKNILKGLNTHNLKNLQSRGRKVRDLIRNTPLPDDLTKEIIKQYYELCRSYKKKNVDVAVRSSATAEDLPDASFAGQQETYLNIRGEKALINACRNCFASLFTDRAISYREEKGFDHFTIGLSIGVQKMVRSDKSVSGVMFSIDTESGHPNVAFISGSYGLGENIVQGAVNPDECYVFKPTLKKGFSPIIQKRLGTKDKKMIYAKTGKSPVKNVPVSLSDRQKFCVTDDELLTLAKWSCIVEDHYSKKAGYFKPMDMEWAKDGESKQLFIVQARPETVQSRKDPNVLKSYYMKQKGTVLVEGNSVGELVGQGKVRVIKNVRDIHSFKKGEILVTEMTDPDWEPIMKIAAGIVTDKGGRVCHAAIISRELGIPCIVGTLNGTIKIPNGKDATIDCSQGGRGFVYKGKVPFAIEEHHLDRIPRPKTDIMMNIGNPDQALDLSFVPTQGVGLAREEFIINEYIGIHPLALVHFKTLKDKKAKKIIEARTIHYKKKSEFFVDKLAQGVGMLAAAFYPRKVIVRLSDFKSDEYANLIGGKEFEPVEDNPMIGWRGASRYYDKKYEKAFALECEALLRVRKDFGLTNLVIMIPFCRTVDEAKKVLKVMASHGLKPGKDGLKVYGMCEIPSNILLADEFLDVLDGFSIGSNDLTQLTLGLDRNSEIVSHLFDERNEAVKKIISQVIKVCNKRGKYIGVCGDAPSTYPDFAKFLVKEGIQSISLSPDAVIKTTLSVYKEEQKMKRK